MAGNSFGRNLVLTTFGESHGVAVGGILDGFPPGIIINPLEIREEMNRRRPGTGEYVSPRKEEDRIEFLSGIFEGKSTGAPIAFVVYNKDQKPEEYDSLKELYRPSHADFTWQQKFGIRDPRGGGRASARETLARVAGGALAKLLLHSRGITVTGAIREIGGFRLPEQQEEADALLKKLKEEGDTTGGVISCSVTGVPAGLGEPVFDRLQADLAKAMLSINAAKGFDYGSGFSGTAMKGSEHNDAFVMKEGRIRTATNFSGGILGGISNGEEICFRVAFKPVSSIRKDQQTVDIQGNPVLFKGKGRHDVCIVFRALPVVEAMAALVIADHLLRAGK